MLNLKSMLQQATFSLSSPNMQGLPDDIGTEIALIGRSNAGKSSALNALTQQKKLAKISKTPGRTQLLNVFKIAENLRIIDLPGYGFAKVPMKIKEKWQQTINEYLLNRNSLKGLIILMDIRLPLQPLDVNMLNWAADQKLNILILLTKSDKLKRGAAINTKMAVAKKVKDISDNIEVIVFSSLKLTGVDDTISVLNKWFNFEHKS